MPILAVRNLDDSIKAKLRLVAAEHGQSMEEEVCQILKRALIHERQEWSRACLSHANQHREKPSGPGKHAYFSWFCFYG